MFCQYYFEQWLSDSSSGESNPQQIIKIETGILKYWSLSVISIMVTPAGFEPAIFWMRTRYPKPLDDGAPFVTLTKRVYGQASRLKNYST